MSDIVTFPGPAGDGEGQDRPRTRQWVPAAKAMAGLGIKALTEPDLIEAAKADLHRRTPRTPYICPLPDDIAPPLKMSLV